MSLTAFSIRLDRIEESLLYQDKAGNYWVSGVLIFETDAKGRTIVVQSIPPERFAAGERGPHLGHWREIGKTRPNQPGSPGKPAFDLNKYKNPPVQNGPPQRDPYPQGEESLFSKPEDAFDAAKKNKPHGLEEIGF